MGERKKFFLEFTQGLVANKNTRKIVLEKTGETAVPAQFFMHFLSERIPLGKTGVCLRTRDSIWSCKQYESV